jgi:hypothetical protein
MFCRAGLSVHIDRALVGVRVRLTEDAMNRHLPCSAKRVGSELALAIDAYVRRRQLGYYPALEHFRDVDVIDKDLLDSAEQIAWLASKLAREEIQLKLRPIFASVSFESIQTQAFAMPTVRPNQKDALEHLARHYTPDTIKLELILSMLRKDTDIAERKVETYARKMIFRWLRDSFENVEITSSTEI